MVPSAISESLDICSPERGNAIGFGHTETASVIEALKAIGFTGYLSGEILPLPNSEAAAAQTIKAIRTHLPR